jgi:cytochrome c oxidase subunit 6b
MAPKKEEEKPVYEMKTAPFDPRFPNTNQARYCYQSYGEYDYCRANFRLGQV